MFSLYECSTLVTCADNILMNYVSK